MVGMLATWPTVESVSALELMCPVANATDLLFRKTRT